MGVELHGKAKSDKRYEVVVKHYLEGVIRMAYFHEMDEARSWLMGCWAEVSKQADVRD